MKNKKLNRDGYVVAYDKKSQKYIPEHRHLIEKEMGRCLEGGEMVHHVNGIKHDNRLENLEVHVCGSHRYRHFENRIGRLAKNKTYGSAEYTIRNIVAGLKTCENVYIPRDVLQQAVENFKETIKKKKAICGYWRWQEKLSWLVPEWVNNLSPKDSVATIEDIWLSDIGTICIRATPILADRYDECRSWYKRIEFNKLFDKGHNFECVPIGKGMIVDNVLKEYTFSRFMLVANKFWH